MVPLGAFSKVSTAREKASRRGFADCIASPRDAPRRVAQPAERNSKAFPQERGYCIMLHPRFRARRERNVDTQALEEHMAERERAHARE